MLIIRILFIMLTSLAVYILAYLELTNTFHWVINTLIISLWYILYFSIFDKRIEKWLNKKASLK